MKNDVSQAQNLLSIAHLRFMTRLDARPGISSSPSHIHTISQSRLILSKNLDQYALNQHSKESHNEILAHFSFEMLMYDELQVSGLTDSDQPFCEKIVVADSISLESKRKIAYEYPHSATLNQDINNLKIGHEKLLKFLTLNKEKLPKTLQNRLDEDRPKIEKNQSATKKAVNQTMDDVIVKARETSKFLDELESVLIDNDSDQRRILFKDRFHISFNQLTSISSNLSASLETHETSLLLGETPNTSQIRKYLKHTDLWLQDNLFIPTKEFMESVEGSEKFEPTEKVKAKNILKGVNNLLSGGKNGWQIFQENREWVKEFMDFLQS